MYMTSTVTDIRVEVTFDLGQLSTSKNTVSYECSRITTKMPVYSELTIQENVDYFLKYYFVLDSVSYRLFQRVDSSA
jgi:ABC-type Na+ transport system ATPase subunit NatA